MSKRSIGRLQNVAITLLSLSAVLLLIIVIPLEMNGENGLIRIERFLTTDQTPTAQTSDLSNIAAPLNMFLTNEYGSRGEILTTTLSDTAVQCASLIREAIGSSANVVTVSSEDFQQSLSAQGIFMDFLTAMPSQVVAGWFGGDFSVECSIRCLSLSVSPVDTCSLYLWDGNGEFLRLETAVPAGALQEYLSTVNTNDAEFAYTAGEDYASLYPYTILPADRITAGYLTAATPAEAVSDKRLLSVLGFNVHTNYRYPESNGTQVIVEYPRELRIQPDGIIRYSGDAESYGDLFTVPGSADEPITASEAALTALRLADEIMPPSLSGSSSFFLSHLEENELGWQVSLDTIVDGIPVYYSDGTNAAEFQFTGGTITSFSIRCRQYVLSDETFTLLPSAQAAAIAGSRQGVMLAAAYVDRGGETVSPSWLLH